MPKESSIVLAGKTDKLELKEHGNKYLLQLKNAGTLKTYSNNPMKGGTNTARDLLNAIGANSSSPLILKSGRKTSCDVIRTPSTM